MTCAGITVLLMTVLLVFYFLGGKSCRTIKRQTEWICDLVDLCPFPSLVQQGGAIRMLTEAVREKEAAAAQLTLLIQELQALRLNLTARRGGT